MNEKVKVSVELDKQFIREIMLAIGITAADPGAANKLLDVMGDEVVLGESQIKGLENAHELKFSFAAIAIHVAAQELDAQEKAEKSNSNS